jgi:dopamine beta-monooxygenase
LHWARGDGPLWDIKGVSLTKASVSQGFKRIRFLKNKNPPPAVHTDPSGAWNFLVLNQKVKLEPVETTYWCQIVKLPDAITKRKHHVIQFGPKIQSGNEELVHHMEVFHCLTDASVQIPLYAGVCDNSPFETKVCSRVIGAWAMGADPLTYPQVAGFPIGGVDFNPYVRLEMHYNNPELKAGWLLMTSIFFKHD